jgi:hypothetical protein
MMALASVLLNTNSASFIRTLIICFVLGFRHVALLKVIFLALLVTAFCHPFVIQATNVVRKLFIEEFIEAIDGDLALFHL